MCKGKSINKEVNIKEELKVEVKNDNNYQKEQFMKEISNNLDLLENFSIERLEKIKEYYEENIKKKEALLSNMKKVWKYLINMYKDGKINLY